MYKKDESSFNEFASDEIASPSTMKNEDYLSGGVAFVIPVDAPVPSELNGAHVAAGTLYERLAPVATQVEDGTFAFAPLSGAELLHLDRAWRLLQEAKKVYVLAGLPGAKYDVMFTQAVRQIGVQRLDWAEVSEALASKLIEDQRLRDKEPWRATDAIDPAQLQAKIDRPRKMSRTLGADVRREEVPIPNTDDDDENS